MTNLVVAVTNKLLITTAYKYVALTMMLTNCNLFLQQTHLPLDHPIVFTNAVLSKCNVNPPRLMGFGGSLVTEKYFFGFGHDHLANFWQWQFRPNETQDIKTQHEQWSQMTSQIGTNEVGRLALLWLMNLGVDIATMERKHTCNISQRFFYRSGTGQLAEQSKVKVMLPVYEISWGAIPLSSHPEYSLPAATMTVFGPTSELVEYHLYDDALMLRPKLAVKDYEQLLAIPNEEFKKYSDLERSNLVMRFTATSARTLPSGNRSPNISSQTSNSRQRFQVFQNAPCGPVQW